MNNIPVMQQSLLRAAAIVKYNPTNCTNISWEFPGTLCPDYIYNDTVKPDVNTDEVTIFDLNTGTWRTMLKDYVTLDHDKWYRHVKFKKNRLPAHHLMREIPKEQPVNDDGTIEYETPVVDVYQWSCLDDDECDQCDMFDRESYNTEIKEYIEKHCDQCGSLGWDKYFKAAQEDDFKATAKELNLNVIDFFVKCDDEATINKCKEQWLKVITKTRDEAYIMLEKDLEHELTAHSQDEGWIEADVRAEIEMVKTLLDSVVGETEKMMNNCYNVFQILRTWPPILLPAPKFINISPMLTKQKILFVSNGSDFEIYDKRII